MCGGEPAFRAAAGRACDRRQVALPPRLAIFEHKNGARSGQPWYSCPQDVGEPHLSRSKEVAMLASTFRILALSALLATALVLSLTVTTP